MSEFAKRTDRTSDQPEQRAAPREAHGNPAPIQAKLIVGAAGDRFEEEADRVAAAVMRDLRRGHGAPQFEDSDGTRIRRSGREPERPLDVENVECATRPRGERTVIPGGGLHSGALDHDTGSAIERARGRGRPLDDEIRRSMGGRFGSDFTGVRIHDDGSAHDLTSRIRANAFTTGSDIFFGAGRFDPSSRGGQELLAHELTHVVQQGGADRTAQRATPARLTELSISAAPGPSVQRQFAGKLLDLTIPQIMKALRDAYAKPPLQSEVQNLVGLPTTFRSVEDIAAHFNLQPLAPQQATTVIPTKGGEVPKRPLPVPRTLPALPTSAPTSGAKSSTISTPSAKVFEAPQQTRRPLPVPVSPVTTVGQTTGASSPTISTPSAKVVQAPQQTRRPLPVPVSPVTTAEPTSGAKPPTMSTTSAKSVGVPQSRLLPMSPVTTVGPTTGVKPPTSSVPSTTPSLVDPGVKQVGPKPVLEKEPEAEGEFRVEGIQGNVNVPLDNQKVIKKEGEVRVTAKDGTSFKMLPGQTFLNTSLSNYLMRHPPEVETITVKRPPTQAKAAADVRVIGDAHHRFVWGAYTGQRIRLKDRPNEVVPAERWAAMTYGPSTNNKGVAKTTVITDKLRAKYFERWVGFGYPKPPKTYVKETLKSHSSTENTPETAADYSSYIELHKLQYEKECPYRLSYKEFVEDVAAKAGAEAAEYKKDLLAQKMSPEPRVMVVNDNPTSRGHFDGKTNRIVLQVAPPLSLLDTLLFEIGNARRKHAYAHAERTGEPTSRGYRKAELEFDVDLEYIAGLKRVYKAKSLDALVETFKIDKKFLVKQDLTATQKKSKPPYVDMPSKGELPAQSHRQALWFWKTSHWDLKEQRHIWVIEYHTNLGMGASDKTYATQ